MFVFCLERRVKPKKILRFYFGAESLERAFDNLIESKACDFCGSTVATAERLCAVIGDKMMLERLWAYLDSVISLFSKGDRDALFNYSSRREAHLSESEMKAAKRALIKFTRRARRICEFEGEISVLDKYYCLISH